MSLHSCVRHYDQFSKHSVSRILKNFTKSVDTEKRHNGRNIWYRGVGFWNYIDQYLIIPQFSVQVKIIKTSDSSTITISAKLQTYLTTH